MTKKLKCLSYFRNYPKRLKGASIWMQRKDNFCDLFVSGIFLDLLPLHRLATINTNILSTYYAYHTHYITHHITHHSFARPDPPLPNLYYLPRSLRLVWLFDKLCTIYYQSSAVLLDPRFAIWLHHTSHHILSRIRPSSPLINVDHHHQFSSLQDGTSTIKHCWILDSGYHSC